MTELFNAVLAEMRDRFDDDREAFDEFKVRLLAAREAEVAEWKARADRAVGLLRECNSVALRRGDRYGLCDAIDNSGNAYQSEQLASLLSEQAGERENGDG